MVRTSLEQESSISKGLDSKYFRLCGPYGPFHNHSALCYNVIAADRHHAKGWTFQLNFTVTVGRPMGYGVLTPGLEHGKEGNTHII